MWISNILDQRNHEVLIPKVSVIGTGSEEDNGVPPFVQREARTLVSTGVAGLASLWFIQVVQLVKETFYDSFAHSLTRNCHKM